MSYRVTGTLSYTDISITAHATVKALERLGFRCCFVGGVACRLFGNTRDPADIDIVVLDTTYSQESLKSRLVTSNPDFYLVASKDPYATYKVLWYRLSIRRSCIVDLLQPGVMNIPSLETGRIQRIGSLPVMPFSVVLLLKLQAWADHRVALKLYLEVKQYTDVADINSLLPIAIAKNVRPRQDTWLPSSFISAAEGRVKDYVLHFPDTRSQWSALGFEVPRPVVPITHPRSRAMRSSKSISPANSTSRRNYTTWGYREPRAISYDSD